jgi:uncharacterized protein YjbI with pentapeptide repeats
MANPEHLAKLKEGAKAWNEWRVENPELTPDLIGAQLRGANLSGADLKAVNFHRADLDDAVL